MGKLTDTRPTRPSGDIGQSHVSCYTDTQGLWPNTNYTREIGLTVHQWELAGKAEVGNAALRAQFGTRSSGQCVRDGSGVRASRPRKGDKPKDVCLSPSLLSTPAPPQRSPDVALAILSNCYS